MIGADGSWRGTNQNWLDARMWRSQQDARHGDGGYVGGAEAQQGYAHIAQKEYGDWLRRPNEEGHGWVNGSDRFYNYGQDMSGYDMKKSYGATGLPAAGVDSWHPGAASDGSGTTRFWELEGNTPEGGSWKTANRRQSSGDWG